MVIRQPYQTDLVPLPSKWDFVWCAWPFDRDPKLPGPYPRPCLVRAAGFMPFGDRDIPWLHVVYCTKQIDKADTQGFVIDDPAELEACGLFEATLVTPGLLKGLPWSPSFFMRRQRDNIGPVVGKASEMTRLRTLAFMPQF